MDFEILAPGTQCEYVHTPVASDGPSRSPSRRCSGKAVIRIRVCKARPIALCAICYEQQRFPGEPSIYELIGEE